MSDEVQPESKGGVSDEELEIAFAGPAHASDRFIVSLRPAGVRIAFCEQPSPATPPRFRSAVMLSYPDGVALYRLLQRMLREPEEILMGAEREAAESSESSNG